MLHINFKIAFLADNSSLECLNYENMKCQVGFRDNSINLRPESNFYSYSIHSVIFFQNYISILFDFYLNYKFCLKIGQGKKHL